MGRAWESEFAEYFSVRVAALRRLAYAICGDWHLAEDLTQITFLQLYRHWSRVREETLDAYTRRILVNAYLSSRRARRRERTVAEVPDRATGVEEPGVGADIGRALAALPPRQRALVVLRHLEDVSVAEAAALLGIAEGTVKSQTSRGLQVLRAALGAPTLNKE